MRRWVPFTDFTDFKRVHRCMDSRYLFQSCGIAHRSKRAARQHCVKLNRAEAARVAGKGGKP